MARFTKITEFALSDALKKLKQLGIKPTIKAIRNELGGGSYSTIIKIKKELAKKSRELEKKFFLLKIKTLSSEVERLRAYINSKNYNDKNSKNLVESSNNQTESSIKVENNLNKILRNSHENTERSFRKNRKKKRKK